MGRRKKSDLPYTGCGCIFLILFSAYGIGTIITGNNKEIDDSTRCLVGLIFIISVAILIFLLKLLIKLYKRRKQEKLLRALRIADIDNMSGLEFEEYIARLLRYMGYKVENIKASGDFGVDIVAKKQDETYAIQVKRHSYPVSRRAISDAVAGKQHYKCDKAMVITNNYFTKDAIALANSCECILIDRDTLSKWIADFQEGKK